MASKATSPLVKSLMKDSTCTSKMFLNLSKTGAPLCKHVRKCSSSICKPEFKREAYCIKSIRNKKYTHTWYGFMLYCKNDIVSN